MLALAQGRHVRHMDADCEDICLSHGVVTDARLASSEIGFVHCRLASFLAQFNLIKPLNQGKGRHQFLGHRHC